MWLRNRAPSHLAPCASTQTHGEFAVPQTQKASHGKQVACLSPAAAPKCTAGAVTATRLCLLRHRRSACRLIAHMFFHLSDGVTQQSGSRGHNFSGAAELRGFSPVQETCTFPPTVLLMCVFVFQLKLFEKKNTVLHINYTLAHKPRQHLPAASVTHYISKRTQ